MWKGRAEKGGGGEREKEGGRRGEEGVVRVRASVVGEYVVAICVGAKSGGAGTNRQAPNRPNAHAKSCPRRTDQVAGHPKAHDPEADKPHGASGSGGSHGGGGDARVWGVQRAWRAVVAREMVVGRVAFVATRQIWTRAGGAGSSGWRDQRARVAVRQFKWEGKSMAQAPIIGKRTVQTHRLL